MMTPVSTPTPGVPDVQTVTSDGSSTLPVIDGVVTRAPVVHLDHRGSLFEIQNSDTELWGEPVVYSYQASVFPGQIKGWSRHEVKTDRYSLAVGELLVLLHDGRAGSPTAGVTQRVVLSARGDRLLVIPAGVWHLLINLGVEEAHVINFPTQPYHHDAPDRFLLDWDTDELPVDVRSYLPKF
jgi:dTDP-4-dehydrorhamnose 3,5-epimerase